MEHIFKTLEEKCLHYRSMTDYRLNSSEYIICMLDGRSFSKVIKKQFKLPFDDTFIGMMDETAKYLCKNVSGCKMAFVQSDEISLVVADDSDSPFFANRLCKIQSILASMAASKFNQLLILNAIRETDEDKDTIITTVESQKLVEFDCKAWNVPTYNDVFAWLLYRQNDCVRNSKQQTAQTYILHKKLQGIDTNEQIALLKKHNNVDWNEYPDRQKYGRFIYPEIHTLHNDILDVDYKRGVWAIHDAFPLNEKKNATLFNDLKLIPEFLNNIDNEW